MEDIRNYTKQEILNMYKTYLEKNDVGLFRDVQNNQCADKICSIDEKMLKELAIIYRLKGSKHNSYIIYSAYRRFIHELKTQYDFIKDTFDISLNSSSTDPYSNYKEMKQDILNNNVLTVWNGGKPVKIMDDIYKGKSINVIFRLVHDLLGHFVDNNDFQQVGEENAYLTHKAFFSPYCHGVLAQETRAQQAAYYFSYPYNTFKEQYVNIVGEKYQ